MTWDYDQDAYQKQAKADPVWHLNRLLTYGTDTEKFDRAVLKKYWPQLRMTNDQKAFLELLLWHKPF